MITIRIVFYNRKTRLAEDDVKMELPEDVVFLAAQTNNIKEINSFMYEISSEMKNVILSLKPNLENKFDQYEYDFIGRHGLGPEYD